ncbi:uncharacterized protein LMH87_008526 [Akanthomyces muscarius]|uniref:Uncharacterized protein n=1 Tax=Akanthomyces muscarius TaxID=2231603 RepID=A0A9W8QGJ0_AKAMU|nr:uncharacterized protein LMH87_008526 [Akanthomyces muscarius]KAJ4157979.1 hypothetical protein LMH87_008526 [Akanthomyces muscarius]
MGEQSARRHQLRSLCTATGSTRRQLQLDSPDKIHNPLRSSYFLKRALWLPARHSEADRWCLIWWDDVGGLKRCLSSSNGSQRGSCMNKNKQC